jgi:PAS domain S-box-containing protein
MKALTNAETMAAFGALSAPGLSSTSERACALDALPDPLFIMKAVRDRHGMIVELTYAFVNEAAARLYDMSVDEVLGHGQRELFPSVKELGIWDSYVGVIESGSPVSFDVPWFQENGVEGSFRVTATRFGDGLLISANDTTRAKRAEQALEQDRVKLRATLDSLMDPHVLMEAVRDESGQIVDFVYVDANSAACTYNRLDYEDLVGRRLLDLQPGNVGSGLLGKYRRVVETGDPLVLDDSIYAQEFLGGQERRYDVRATRVGDGLSYTWRDVTDRYLAAEAAQRTATVVESSGEAIMSATLDGVVTSWNPASEKLYGYSSGEIIGRPSRPMIPDDLVVEQRAMLDEVKAGRTIKNLEMWRVRKDGTKFPASLTISPILDEDGTVVGVSAIARDLTEQRKANEVAQRLAAIVENSEDAIIGKTLDGIITTWNPAAERLYGYCAKEVIGTSITVLLPKSQAGEFEEILAKIRGGEHVEHRDTIRVRKDGSLIPVAISVSPIRDPNGTIIGASTIARDLTPQEEAANLSRSMIEASLDLMVSLSPEGKITNANQAAARFTGVGCDELVGTCLSDYFTQPERAEEVFQRVLTQGSVADYPLTLRHQDGHETDTEVIYNASTYRDTHGNLLGVFAATRDVSKQVQALREAAHEHANELDRLAELERFQRLTVGRELKMMELKKEIEHLKQHGHPQT